MNVVLIFPPNFHRVRSFGSVATAQETFIPLGILYLASYIEKYSGHSVAIVDGQKDYRTIDEIVAAVLVGKPDVAGISVSTFVLYDAIEILNRIKSANPEIQTVLGGPHAGVMPENFLYAALDFAIAGEAETKFLHLLKVLESGDRDGLAAVPGLTYRRPDGRIHRSGARAVPPALDDLPFPALEKVRYKTYSHAMSKSRFTVPMITSRGCPLRCPFCAVPPDYRHRSVPDIVREITRLAALGVEEIHFMDDTFNLDRDRVMALCAKLREENFRIKWSCRARLDTVDAEVLDQMKKSGCTRVHYGVETANPERLRQIRKGITVAQIERAVALTNAAGIDTLLYFMIGYPEETREECLATLQFALDLQPTFAFFFVLMAYPGTELYADALRNGYYDSDYWREFIVHPTKQFRVQSANRHMDMAALQRMLNEMNRRYYLDPAALCRIAGTIRSCNEAWLKVTAGLRLLREACAGRGTGDGD